MKNLGLTIILALLAGGSLAFGQDKVVGLETIGGVPTLTLEREIEGVFRFLSIEEKTPIQGLRIVYQNKKNRTKKYFTSDEQGYATLSLIWNQESPVMYGSSVDRLPEGSFMPEERFTPLGTLKVQIKKKWIRIPFPHEPENKSPIVLEFIDWVENKEKVNKAVDTTAVSAPH